MAGEDEGGIPADLYGPLLDNLTQSVFLKDAAGRLIYVNDTYCAWTGRKKEESLGCTDHDLYPKHLADKYRADDEYVTQTNQPLELIEENTGADGEPRYVQVIKKPLVHGGKPVGVQGMFWDVTDQMRAQSKSRENEERVLRIARATNDTVWDWDLIVEEIWWSEGITSVWGYDSEAVQSSLEWWAERLHPEDRDRICQSLDDAVEGDDDNWSEEYRFRTADGNYRTVLDRGVKIRDESGKAVRMIGSIMDLSERKRAEEALRESEERLRLTMEAAQDAMWDLDFQRDTCWWNQPHESLLGPLPDDPRAVRAWWRERLHPEDRDTVLEAFQLTVDEPGANHWARDYRLLDKDGETLFVQDRAYISRDASGKAVRILGALRDLTKLRHEQEERERLGQKMLEAQKLESLGVLAGGIAHDFNNLLTSILGNINLVQLELTTSSPVQSYLEEVEKSSIRAADLCRQMLAYSGKGRFVVRTISLTTVIEEMTQLLEVSVGKQALLKFDLTRGLPLVSADPTQLRQIVMNLVVNASEAIGDKSGIVGLATGVMRADRNYLRGTYLSPDIPEGDYVYLEINDTGDGMDKDTLDRIFDPFFTTKFTGRGLGLPAVLGIVRGHKGALRVDSEPGQGTTFKLLLPCAPPDAQPTEERSPLEGVRGSGLVLIIDDEETVRTTTARMLESAGYQTMIAADGCEGLSLFKQRADEVQLVMLDLTMPHMDGVETFREIRQVNPDAAVILMSGYNEQEAVQQFIGKGLAGFIQKPFLISALLGRVREVLNKVG